MTTMLGTRALTGGVDTHSEVHVAAVIDHLGGVLGVESFPVDRAGYGSLTNWMSTFGEIGFVGVEGTGSYGAGLARHLARAGLAVVEVDRPNRQERARAGKSDPLDAIEAARAAQSGRAFGAAKSRDGDVEAIRIVTAKHGQSPINPANLSKIGHTEQTVLDNAHISQAQETNDDVALLWLKDQGQTQQAVDALSKDKHGPNTAHIDTIYSSQTMKDQFGDPALGRTPDIIVQPTHGTIYSTSPAKVAEHGGFTKDDRNVALLVVHGGELERRQQQRQQQQRQGRRPRTRRQRAG